MNESHIRGIAKVIQKLPSPALAAEAQAELQLSIETVRLARTNVKADGNVSDLSPALKAKAAKW